MSSFGLKDDLMAGASAVILRHEVALKMKVKHGLRPETRVLTSLINIVFPNLLLFGLLLCS